MTGKTCIHCNQPVIARMMCKRHYSAWYYRKGQLAMEGIGPTCLVEDCDMLRGPRMKLCPRHANRARKWGLDAATFVEWLSRDCCDSCGSKTRLCFDHDHDHCAQGCSECIRGVLCHNCNIALGMLKDDAATVTALANYIQARKNPENKL